MKRGQSSPPSSANERPCSPQSRAPSGSETGGNARAQGLRAKAIVEMADGLLDRATPPTPLREAIRALVIDGRPVASVVGVSVWPLALATQFRYVFDAGRLASFKSDSGETKRRGRHQDEDELYEAESVQKASRDTTSESTGRLTARPWDLLGTAFEWGGVRSVERVSS